MPASVLQGQVILAVECLLDLALHGCPGRAKTGRHLGRPGTARDFPRRPFLKVPWAWASEPETCQRRRQTSENQQPLQRAPPEKASPPKRQPERPAKAPVQRGSLQSHLEAKLGGRSEAVPEEPADSGRPFWQRVLDEAQISLGLRCSPTRIAMPSSPALVAVAQTKQQSGTIRQMWPEKAEPILTAGIERCYRNRLLTPGWPRLFPCGREATALWCLSANLAWSWAGFVLPRQRAGNRY